MKYISILKNRIRPVLLKKVGVNMVNSYVTSAPSAQNALDIFKGEWSSKLPNEFNLQAGSSGLFEDERITWINEQLGSISGMTVLELGPLEAGHTYMLERLGARSIVSVEANTRAFLKCLVIKELLQLKRASFLCGDFVEYLRSNTTKFDICVASGVLYHMRNPVEVIRLAAEAADILFLWTHYYDSQVISQNPNLAHRFDGNSSATYNGFQHTLYRYAYKSAVNFQSFCGGSAEYSNWLSREDILTCLKVFGYTTIQVNFDNPQHPNGPSFAVLAIRE